MLHADPRDAGDRGDTEVVHAPRQSRASGALILLAGGLHQSDAVVTESEPGGGTMQGHVRKRGQASWEYIADIGLHAAECC